MTNSCAHLGEKKGIWGGKKGAYSNVGGTSGKNGKRTQTVFKVDKRGKKGDTAQSAKGGQFCTKEKQGVVCNSFRMSG